MHRQLVRRLPSVRLIGACLLCITRLALGDSAAPAPAPPGGGTITPRPPEAMVPWTLTLDVLGQFDAYSFMGPGVSSYQRVDGTTLSPGMEVHRVRTSFFGTFAERLYYNVVLDLGPPNAGGPGQIFNFRGGLAIASLDYKFADALTLRIGQFPLPVTWDNMKPGFATDFMEASELMSIVCPVTCSDMGLMALGVVGPLTYGVGIFNGEGRNRTAVDARADLDGRVSVSFNRSGSNRLKLGLSGRYGVVDPHSAWGDAPASGFTTERGYRFWDPVYVAYARFVPSEIHVVPSNVQRAVGSDLVLELGDFDVQAEGAYVNLGRREVTGASPDAEQTLRAGALTGFIYYVTAGLWLLKPTSSLKATRWGEAALGVGKYKVDEPYRSSLQLLARWEQLFLNYDSVSRSPPEVERGLLDKYTTKIRADILKVALVYWLSTKFKVAVEWGLYMFPGQALSDGRRVENQALAPGAIIPGERGTRLSPETPPEVTPASNPSYFMPPAPASRHVQEISARVQMRF